MRKPGIVRTSIALAAAAVASTSACTETSTQGYPSRDEHPVISVDCGDVDFFADINGLSELSFLDKDGIKTERHTLLSSDPKVTTRMDTALVELPTTVPNGREAYLRMTIRTQSAISPDGVDSAQLDVEVSEISPEDYAQGVTSDDVHAVTDAGVLPGFSVPEIDDDSILAGLEVRSPVNGLETTFRRLDEGSVGVHTQALSGFSPESSGARLDCTAERIPPVR